jgi:hypothetical protein
MIRPVRFDFNTQTAASNAFQNASAKQDAQATQAAALQEFDTFVSRLRAEGVNVSVAEDTPEPHTPDSIFPNNWVSFHEDGSVILYPMYAPNRRLERRQDILDKLGRDYLISRIEDLSDYEAKNLFLEGTGSLILDRENRIAYACLSPRADKKLLAEFGEQFGYEMMIFDSVDRGGKQIYHTNVVMCMGDRFVVICLDTIKSKAQREDVVEMFHKTGKEIVAISSEQMENFAGNMLHIANQKGESLLVMSERAYQSLLPAQVKTLEKYAKLVYSPLTVIENNGGGSARCMMAEVFLPKK